MNWRHFELGVLRPVLANLEPSISSSEVAVRLVGETIWHESDRLQALGQYPRGDSAVFGPGLGICSMERPTWNWLVKDHILRRSDLEQKFKAVTGLWIANEYANFYEHFAWNLALNVAACRLRYFAYRGMLPENTIEDRSQYWLKIYNGSGVEERREKYVKDAMEIPWLS